LTPYSEGDLGSSIIFHRARHRIRRNQEICEFFKKDGS
jgi:hypothetical protein